MDTCSCSPGKVTHRSEDVLPNRRFCTHRNPAPDQSALAAQRDSDTTCGCVTNGSRGYRRQMPVKWKPEVYHLLNKHGARRTERASYKRHTLATTAKNKGSHLRSSSREPSNWTSLLPEVILNLFTIVNKISSLVACVYGIMLMRHHGAFQARICSELTRWRRRWR